MVPGLRRANARSARSRKSRRGRVRRSPARGDRTSNSPRSVAARRRGAAFGRARVSATVTSMTTRREFLAITAGAFAIAGLPGIVFAAAPGDRRLVLVLLRGALDGLAAVPPLGDLRYVERRGAIALEPYYRKGELLIVPASGNGYRTRSHFDAQDLMECGLSSKAHETDGWLNR